MYCKLLSHEDENLHSNFEMLISRIYHFSYIIHSEVIQLMLNSLLYKYIVYYQHSSSTFNEILFYLYHLASIWPWKLPLVNLDLKSIIIFYLLINKLFIHIIIVFYEKLYPCQVWRTFFNVHVKSDGKKKFIKKCVSNQNAYHLH